MQSSASRSVGPHLWRVVGVHDGDTVTWSNSITTPFPMTLEFTGKLDGDTLNGSVKAGSFGSFPFTGSRA